MMMPSSPPPRGHWPSPLTLVLPALVLLVTLLTRVTPIEAKDGVTERFIQFDSSLVSGQAVKMEFRADEDLLTKARTFLATANLTGTQQLWGCPSVDHNCHVRMVRLPQPA